MNKIGLEVLSSALDEDFEGRISRVNSIINQAMYFDAQSSVSGRRISGNVCVPTDIQEERLLVVPGQFLSTAKNTVATNAAISEATGLVVVGLELPGHGDSEKATKEEFEMVRYHDYSWLAEEYEDVLYGSDFIAQFDSMRRFVYGISAGAMATAHMVEHGDGKYEKVAFLEPANFVPRKTLKNLGSFLFENFIENGKGSTDLEKYNVGLEAPKSRITDLGAVSAFFYMFNNYVWHGETSQSIIRFLEQQPDMKTGITLCSDSRVVTKNDVNCFNKEIKSRSAKLASRVPIEVIQGLNHSIGRYPLIIGQLADRAFER